MKSRGVGWRRFYFGILRRLHHRQRWKGVRWPAGWLVPGRSLSRGFAAVVGAVARGGLGDFEGRVIQLAAELGEEGGEVEREREHSAVRVHVVEETVGGDANQFGRVETCRG